MAHPARRWLVNAALALGSALLTYGLLELGVRWQMDRLPPHVFNLFPRELKTLGQTSKADLVPRHPWVAIIGDSYGEGRGDWFVETGRNRNARFQAAHLVQDATGLDVASLSRAGAGNYDGLAIYAVNATRMIARWVPLPPPAFLFVYFYEGNDLDDNLRFYERYYRPGHDAERVFDDAYFGTFDAEMDRRFCRGAPREIEGNFLVAKAMGSAIENLARAAKNEQPTPRPSDGSLRARVGGRLVPIHESLLALDVLRFDDAEIALALRLFERALHRARDVWPHPTSFVVYIPSPLTSYAIEGHDAGRRLARSRAIAAKVAAAANAHGYAFLDLSDDVRRAAASRLLHGPTDWSHFNRAGYEVLAERMTRAITAARDSS